jgi:hypothetical protein
MFIITNIFPDDSDGKNLSSITEIPLVPPSNNELGNINSNVPIE